MMARRSRQEKKQKNHNKIKLSDAERGAADAITNEVSKPSFNKQQRKEIQTAIEQGIARYKREHKSKARDYDKALKQQLKQYQSGDDDVETLSDKEPPKTLLSYLPWLLLVISWAGFVVYLGLDRQ